MMTQGRIGHRRGRLRPALADRSTSRTRCTSSPSPTTSWRRSSARRSRRSTSVSRRSPRSSSPWPKASSRSTPKGPYVSSTQRRVGFSASRRRLRSEVRRSRCVTKSIASRRFAEVSKEPRSRAPRSLATAPCCCTARPSSPRTTTPRARCSFCPMSPSRSGSRKRSGASSPTPVTRCAPPSPRSRACSSC